MFCIYLRTNSDLCHLQRKLIGFYNRDEKCLQRGTYWVFKQSSLRFVFKGLSTENRFIICSLLYRVTLQMFVTMEVLRLLQKDEATFATLLVLLLGVTKSSMGNLSLSRVSYPLSHVWYGCLGRFGDRIPTLCACYYDCNVM